MVAAVAAGVSVEEGEEEDDGKAVETRLLRSGSIVRAGATLQSFCCLLLTCCEAEKGIVFFMSGRITFFMSGEATFFPSWIRVLLYYRNSLFLNILYILMIYLSSFVYVHEEAWPAPHLSAATQVKEIPIKQ